MSQSINHSLANLVDGSGASVSGGLEVYATKENLPTTGLTEGDQAYVSSTRRFYISNGSGWYNVALANATPALTISPTGEIELDTAGSAKDLAEGKDKSIAAIASELSAKMYNLKILKKNIEDDKGNVTRFLIMGKNVEQPDYDDKKKFLTSCIFRVKSEPSALYKCLGGFATNQVNLTKLESFSVKNTFEQANFYLDIEGHLEQPKVKKALEELGFHTETLDILGVYESSAFRQK